MDTGSYSEESAYLSSNMSSSFSNIRSIAVDRSVKFTYEELAAATDNFSIAKKIGQGGFGSVFYGEIRGLVGTYIK
jgi:chitin elicitor receptor kinase 1